MGRGNPTELFPTDDPIAANEMIGRQADVEQLVVRLDEAGINVVIAGARRTGKTTVCRAAIAELGRRGFYTVSIDLFHLSRVDQIADALIEGTIANRPALNRLVHGAKKAGRTVYEAFEHGAGARIAGTGELEGIDFGVLPELQRDPDAYFDYALRLPERIADIDGKRLILFIDEFQDVIRIGNDDFTGGSVALARKMRAVFQDCSHVGFLFAGSLEHLMRNLFSDPNEAFFNFGSFYDLSEISPEQWREGLSLRFDRDNTRLDSVALERLIELGEEHPRSTMLIAQQAHLASVIAGNRHVTRPIVDVALIETMRSERKRHEALEEKLQALGGGSVGRSALPIARAIALGRAADSAASSVDERKRALKALRDAGIIEPSGRAYRIAEPFFARYLRELDLPEITARKPPKRRRAR